ncbi:MAG: DUF4352 domain-containing protein [Actinobacteria bacterium]|nr:DUF4352 domain-containing protein [Actinomycetota bacterium]
MRRRKLTGRDMFYVLRTATAALLIAVAVLAGGCGGGEDASSPPANEEVAEQDVAEQTEPAREETASIGDVVTVGDVQWSVTDAEELDELVSNKGEYEPGNFVVVDITLRNNSNQDLTVATPFLTLVDDQGRESEAEIDTNFTYLYPEENMFVGQVRPGSVKEGKAIFAVNSDGEGFELRVGGARFASDETASIDLGI